MATIDIVDLKVRTIIGTHPWERKNKQELIVNLSLSYDSSMAARTDRLQDALDYEQIANIVIQTIEKSNYFLIEKLSHKVLERLRKFKSIQSLSLRIDKPQAIAQAKSVSYKVNIQN